MPLTYPPVIAGRVAATGAITAGVGFTVTKGVTGTWTLNFSRIVTSCVVSPAADFAGFVVVDTFTTAPPTCRVKLYSNTVAALDQPFNFIAW